MNDHTGETVMMTREQKRRVDVADVLRALLDDHTTGTMYRTWDNCRTQADKELAAILNEANGRGVLLYLPPSRPGRTPIEMVWRTMRYNVTQCELFMDMLALTSA